MCNRGSCATTKSKKESFFVFLLNFIHLYIINVNDTLIFKASKGIIFNFVCNQNNDGKNHPPVPPMLDSEKHSTDFAKWNEILQTIHHPEIYPSVLKSLAKS